MNQEIFEKAQQIIVSKQYQAFNESLQVVLKSLSIFKQFKDIYREERLFPFMHNYLKQFLNSISHKVYQTGQIIDNYCDKNNQLFLIFSGKVYIFIPKNQIELDSEVFWRNEFDKEENLKYQQFLLQQKKHDTSTDQKQAKHQVRSQRQSGQKQQRSKTAHSKCRKDKNQEPSSDQIGNQEQQITVQKNQNTIQILQFFNDEKAKILPKSYGRIKYFSLNNLCYFKFHEGLSAGDSFGTISNKVSAVVPSDYTAIVASDAFIVSIAGPKYYEIFGELNDKLQHCLRVIEKTFYNLNNIIQLEIVFKFKEEKIGKDKQIYEENDKPECFYLLKEGEIYYQKDSLKLMRLEKGEIFGHEELFFTQSRLQRFRRAFSIINASEETTFYYLEYNQMSSQLLLQLLMQQGQSKYHQLMVKYQQLLKLQVTIQPIKKSYESPQDKQQCIFFPEPHAQLTQQKCETVLNINNANNTKVRQSSPAITRNEMAQQFKKTLQRPKSEQKMDTVNQILPGQNKSGFLQDSQGVIIAPAINISKVKNFKINKLPIKAFSRINEIVAKSTNTSPKLNSLTRRQGSELYNLNQDDIEKFQNNNKEMLLKWKLKFNKIDFFSNISKEAYKMDIERPGTRQIEQINNKLLQVVDSVQEKYAWLGDQNVQQQSGKKKVRIMQLKNSADFDQIMSFNQGYLTQRPSKTNHLNNNESLSNM